VALHGAIGSRNLRKIASDDAAYIKIYRADDDMRTSSIVIPVEEFSSIKVAKWEVFISESALQSLFSDRSGKLPKETGGILIGFFNMQYHTLYIVDIVGEIADSIEYPDAFIRGHGGLPEKIKAVQDRTAGNLTYVGEWHSHPDRSKCWPSNDDKKVIGWINDHMAAEGVPPVMLIVGDKAQLCVCIENGAKILEWKNAGEEFPVAV
jgi:integrative and conjugative element protein (TIGR02256 family)